MHSQHDFNYHMGLGFACWVIIMLLLSFADFFFRITFFENILSETPSECQNTWFKIRTDVLSVLIWVQTFCKGYELTTKVSASNETGVDCILVNKNKKCYGYFCNFMPMHSFAFSITH